MKGTLHSQSSSTAGTSPSDCLVLYLGHSLVGVGWGSYPPAEKQSVYSTAPVKCQTVLFQIIQFSISIQFRHQNSSILSNSVQH